MVGNDEGITRIDGSWFWPITALISFFGTISFLLTTLLRGAVPGPLGEWLPSASILFGAVALFTSLVGSISILLCGIHNVGGVTFKGRRVGNTLVGACYLLSYLPGALLVLV